MSSCTEDIYNPDKVKEDYEQNFVDLFGEIDPNQDWNVAELKSVTVDPGSSTEVQIYAKNGDVYKLVGDYKEVSGTRTLTFDAAKGVDDFYVVAGGQGKPAKNGESVSFTDAGTRSYEDYNGWWDPDPVFTVKDDYVTFPWEDVMAYAERLPNDPDGDNLEVDGISTNFDLVMGNDEITVYPVYWNASFDHTLGIYWYDEDGKMKEQDIYTDKEGDDVQVWVDWSSNRVRDGWSSVTWNTFESPEREYGYDRIASHIYKFDEVDTMYLLSGSFEFVCIVKGKTMQEVAHFVASKLACVDGVTGTSTYFVLKQYKNRAILYFYI